MAAITGIVHTCNDEMRIGRALETLGLCDEILVVDHGSRDQTLQIAREYGVSIRAAVSGEAASAAARAAKSDWVLCLQPSESISEGLEASLYEWKLYQARELSEIDGAAVCVREEEGGRWTEFPPELRLVRRTWNCWQGLLPSGKRQWKLLQGDLLRFRQP